MTNYFKSLNPIIKNEVNIIWIGFFLFILAVTGSWFSITISSPNILKFYVASFGGTLLLILGLYCKCKTPNINLTLNSIKLSLTLLFVLGIFSLLWTINFDFAFTLCGRHWRCVFGPEKTQCIDVAVRSSVQN